MKERAFVAIAVTLIVACVASAWLGARQLPSGMTALEPSLGPVLTTVQSSGSDLGMEAQISLQVVPSPPLLSAGTDGIGAGANGVVTSLALKDGSSLKAGQAALSVNGVQITAYSGTQVLFRPLGAGAKGPDVRAAQQLLQKLVPDAGVKVTGTVDAATTKAITQWAAKIGASGNELQPSWFVWLPRDPYLVKEVKVALGGPYPATGGELATSTPIIASVTITTPGEPTSSGPYVLTASGSSVPVTWTKQQWQVTDAQRLQEMMTDQLVGATPPQPVKAVGHIGLATPQQGLSVPGSSLQLANDASYCLIKRVQDSWSLVKVGVVGGSLDGQALIAATSGESVQAGDEVLMNPGDVKDAPACR